MFYLHNLCYIAFWFFQIYTNSTMDYQVNLLAVVIATLLQFVVGAVWYTFIFGKLWGEIHGFHKLPKETQDKMKKEITPYYALQLLVTIISSFVLAILITNL